MSLLWETPANVLNGHDVLIDPVDSTIAANAVVKRSMRLNLRRWLFRRAARRYGFYRAFLAAEKGYAEARQESEQRGQAEGLGEDVMASGLFGDIKATLLFCVVVLMAACAVEGLR